MLCSNSRADIQRSHLVLLFSLSEAHRIRGDPRPLYPAEGEDISRELEGSRAQATRHSQCIHLQRPARQGNCLTAAVGPAHGRDEMAQSCGQRSCVPHWHIHCAGSGVHPAGRPQCHSPERCACLPGTGHMVLLYTRVLTAACLRSRVVRAAVRSGAQLPAQHGQQQVAEPRGVGQQRFHAAGC